jgi:hypothetical protein
MKHQFCFILLFTFFSFITKAQSNWFVNFTPGFSDTPPIPLTVKQDGYPKLSFLANYKSLPLKKPPYYSIRIGFKSNSHGWEAELNHLKIYLKNKPEEIERFAVSHGYNQIFINKIKEGKRFGTKTGFGCVVAHPENTIRNLTLNQNGGIFHSGYYLSGLAFQYCFFKEFEIGKRFCLLAESSATIAFAIVPINNGVANTPVFGLHLKVGPGYYFIRRKTNRDN